MLNILDISSMIIHYVTKQKSSQTDSMKMTGFSVLPQSPDLNSRKHYWNVVEREICSMSVQLTDLQQLCDAIMSTLTRHSKEFLEAMPQRIQPVQRAKWVLPFIIIVFLIKCPPNLHNNKSPLIQHIMSSDCKVKKLYIQVDRVKFSLR